MIRVVSSILFGSLPNINRVINVFEIPKLGIFTIDADKCPPPVHPLVEGHTCLSGGVPAVHSLIPHVLRLVSDPKISQLVIGRITIDMVDRDRIDTIHHFPNDTVCRVCFPINSNAHVTSGSLGPRYFTKAFSVENRVSFGGQACGSFPDKNAGFGVIGKPLVKVIGIGQWVFSHVAVLSRVVRAGSLLTQRFRPVFHTIFDCFSQAVRGVIAIAPLQMGYRA